VSNVSVKAHLIQNLLYGNTHTHTHTHAHTCTHRIDWPISYL